ncbi:HNH endonuclease [Mesorhizobium intechi]|uniref:HNH endonuclease n=1 Tax=Mesorhizobium intechi TaxID=537601 RepID=UPI000CC5D9B9|nr:HNH endonuclease [Mesorhizobium intechi]TSE03749.1 HNH endonuclease [Mesorhizobium intechi]
MKKIPLLKPAIRTLDTRSVQPPKKVADPFYASGPWRKLLATIIKERGRSCEDPDHDGSRHVPGMIYGDHIVELQDGGAALDPANVLMRCPSCHTRKTLRVRGERMAERYR